MSPLPRKKSGVAPTRASVGLIHASSVKSSCTGRVATVPKANPVNTAAYPAQAEASGNPEPVSTPMSTGGAELSTIGASLDASVIDAPPDPPTPVAPVVPPEPLVTSEPDIPPVVEPPAFPPAPLV